MRFPVFSKFSVLLIRDITTFGWIYALFIPPYRVGLGIAAILAMIAGRTTAHTKHMPEPLTRSQMHVRAAIAIVGFCLWIIGIIWAAVAMHTPQVWAVASVFIPVLCVLGYTSVRVKLAMEPNIDPTNVGL
jgi:hypothetical protein